MNVEVRMILNKTFMLFYIFSFCSVLLFAKTNEVFSTIEFGFEAGSEVTENRYHEYWDKGISINSFAIVPYYYGSFELGFQYTEYKAKKNKAKDLEDISISLGWGKSIPIFKKVELYNSVSFVNHIMKIIYTSENSSESEISLNVNSQVKYNFLGNYKFIAGIKYSTMYTFHKIHHSFYFIGISYSINTPAFIKRFLQ